MNRLKKIRMEKAHRSTLILSLFLFTTFLLLLISTQAALSNSNFGHRRQLTDFDETLPLEEVLKHYVPQRYRGQIRPAVMDQQSLPETAVWALDFQERHNFFINQFIYIEHISFFNPWNESSHKLFGLAKFVDVHHF